MKIHIINLFLSRKGGGIYTVIKELYNSSIFEESRKNITFWGFEDNYSLKDSKNLNGNLYLFKSINPFYFSKRFLKKTKEVIGIGDIVHLHSLWMYPSLVLLKLKKKKKFKKIISPHGMLDKWALNNSKFKKNISLFFFEKKNLRTADCIHALCKQEYDDIRKIAPRVPIAIIPNGIFLPSKMEVVGYKEKTILFLGRLHPKKGLDNLIKAWLEINNEDWKLLIVGPDEGGYKKIIENQKLLKSKEINIEILDGVFGKDKERLFLKSSGFILPSFSEGLPMSILEAWSYKLPVLMTKECNLEEGFISNAAIQIDSSKEGIKKGISDFINLPESDRLILGQNGYNLVEKQFTWGQVSQKVKKMYQWVNDEIDKPEFIHLD